MKLKTTIILSMMMILLVIPTLVSADYNQDLILKYYLDETNGNDDAIDYSGNGYDLFPTGTLPKDDFGRTGYNSSAYFEKSGLYSTYLINSWTMTYEMMMYNTTQIQVNINDYLTFPPRINLRFRAIGGTRGILAYYETDTFSMDFGTQLWTLAFDEPYTITATYNNNTGEMRAYLDGQYLYSSITNETGGSVNMTDFQVGTIGSLGRMSLRNVAFWNRTLTDEEIANITQFFPTNTTKTKYCDNHPSAIFCDDAETGSMGDKWTYDGTPSYSNIADGGIVGFTPVKSGHYSIRNLADDGNIYADITDATRVRFWLSRDVSTMTRMFFGDNPNNGAEHTAIDVASGYCDTDEIGILVYNSTIEDYDITCTGEYVSVENWYEITALIDETAQTIQFYIDNTNLGTYPYFPSLATKTFTTYAGTGGYQYIDEFLAEKSFCQLNNNTNVMFCDDAEGTNDICDTQYWGYGGYADCLRQNMTYSTEKPFQGSKSILTPTNLPTEEGAGWVYGDFSFLNMTTSAFEINFDIYYQKNASDTYFNPQHSIEGSGAGTYWSVGYYPTFGSDDYLTCFFGFTTCENLTFTANTWHHYNITTDGSTLILYLNGVEAGRADGVSGVYNFLMDSIGAQSQAETADDKLYMDNFIITQKTLTLPNITSFTTTNDTILNGTSTQLDWNVNYATDLDLNGVNVSGLTAYNVSPTINTTYTLTATNENGSVNANLTINVYYPPPCTPNYYCSQTGTCNASNTIPCLNVSDMNECGIPYNPLNYSDYNQNCTYTIPSQGYTPTYGTTDLIPATYDYIVGILVGLAGIALLLGLGVGLSIFAKSDTGKNIMKNLKR